MLRQAARAAVSRAICSGRGATLVAPQLPRALQLYALTDVAGGHAVEVPEGDLLNPYPAVRKHGVDADRARRAFKLAQRRQGWQAEAPEIDLLIDERLWPAVEALLLDGAPIAAARIEMMLEEQMLEMRPANRRAAAGPYTRGSLSNWANQLIKVMKGFVALRAEGHPLDEIAAWTAAPEIEIPDAPTGAYRVQAPPFPLVRQAFAELDAEIKRRLGVDTLEGEQEVLGGLAELSRSNFWVRKRPLLNLLRKRAVISVLICTGLRAGAITRLRRVDFLEDYAGPQPDHRTGFALRSRPRKSLGAFVERIKPIPDEVGWFIKAYLLLEEETVRRTLAGDVSPSHRPATWLTRGEEPTRIDSAEAPLFLGAPGRTMPVKSQTISAAVAGVVSLPRSQRAFVQRQGALAEGTDEELRPYIGYTAHEYRHLAYQLAVRAGAMWIEDNAGHESALLTPKFFAHALLDHSNVDSALGDIYGDRGDHLREVLAGRASDGIWAQLRSDVGARKRPNVELYRTNLLRLHDIESDIKKLGRLQNELVRRRAVLDESPPPEASNGDKLDFLIGQVEELREIALEGHGLTHAAIELSAQRAAVVKELDVLRFDERTWERIPDSAPPGAERVDLDELEAGALGHALLPAGSAPEPIRDWLTVTEFCEVAAVSRPTATRWLRGEHLPRDEKSQPWPADQVPVDDTLGKRYRRIWMPGVNPDFFSSRLMRERRDELLAQWPIEQGWTDASGNPGQRCQAAIEIDDRIRRKARRRARDSRSEKAA